MVTAARCAASARMVPTRPPGAADPRGAAVTAPLPAAASAAASGAYPAPVFVDAGPRRTARPAARSGDPVWVRKPPWARPASSAVAESDVAPMSAPLVASSAAASADAAELACEPSPALVSAGASWSVIPASTVACVGSVHAAVRRTTPLTVEPAARSRSVVLPTWSAATPGATTTATRVPGRVPLTALAETAAMAASSYPETACSWASAAA